MVVHRDRLVVLSFMTSPNNTYAAQKPSALPIVTTPCLENMNFTIDDPRAPRALPFTNTVVKTLRDYIGHENHEHLTNKHHIGK